jgi:hypothetical protein
MLGFSPTLTVLSQDPVMKGKKENMGEILQLC